MKKEVNIWPHILIVLLLSAAAVLFILGLSSCTKEPMFNPDCGVIVAKTQCGDTWMTVYRWNTGECDTIVWHFDPGSEVGDTICKLTEVNINDLNCKR